MPRRFDYMPWVVIGAVLGVLLIGFVMFPTFQHYISHEDCIGHGATNCE